MFTEEEKGMMLRAIESFMNNEKATYEEFKMLETLIKKITGKE